MTEDDLYRRQWGEDESRAFLEWADVVVPARAEQIQILRQLIPADRSEAFAVAELGAGDGSLASGILEHFPRCSYWALKRSPAMRERLTAILAPFRDRVEVRAFDLVEPTWRTALPAALRCVLASLVVHHLSGPDKRTLFHDIASALDRGGGLLLADLVEPTTPWERELFARQWDEAVRSQSLAHTGTLGAYETFRRQRWNYYTDPTPDPYDVPSTLAEQLQWLTEAGFESVACFWMHAGHAIFGGYRSADPPLV